MQLSHFMCMVFHWECMVQGVDIQVLMQGPEAEAWGR